MNDHDPYYLLPPTMATYPLGRTRLDKTAVYNTNGGRGGSRQAVMALTLDWARHALQRKLQESSEYEFVKIFSVRISFCNLKR